MSLPAAVSTNHRADTIDAYQKCIERVIAHMKSHLDQPLDLDELAQIAAMSKFHMVRVFDELTFTTPHHFLACLRMQRAKEMLLEPDTAITEVCNAVGYSSLGTFSKTFSNLVGLSPAEFRKMPRRLTLTQFATAVWNFLASDRKVSGPAIEGRIDAPKRPNGFIFVGTFTGGVPQGIPFSGTVMVKPGFFRIKKPKESEFHLMAVLIPFSAKLGAMIANLPVGLVASKRLNLEKPGHDDPNLRLRPIRATDPPIVLALPPLLK